MNKVSWGYCTHSWNPIAMRCTPVSAGCDHCWHLTMADRLAKNPLLDTVHKSYTGEQPPRLVGRRLMELYSLKKPSIIAVQFMGDLFHEDVTDHQCDRIWTAMHDTHRHMFLVLTKRPQRMREWLAYSQWDVIPLPNVYLGVTVENQRTAGERIPILLQIPAAGRWLSIEPMLGPVDLYPAFCGFQPPSWGCGPDLDGVVLGGESGSGARPMHPDWARGIRDQCADSGVPFHFKSWGAWAPAPNAGRIRYKTEVITVGDADMTRVGAKAAGRLLDGREHNETAWDVAE